MTVKQKRHTFGPGRPKAASIQHPREVCHNLFAGFYTFPSASLIGNCHGANLELDEKLILPSRSVLCSFTYLHTALLSPSLRFVRQAEVVMTSS